jgi:alpha-1,3-rhamnosyl/mannosyltransferase
VPPNYLIDDGMAVGKVGGIGYHTAELARRLDARVMEHSILRRLPRILSRIAYQLELQLLTPAFTTQSPQFGHTPVNLIHFANFHSPVWKLPGTDAKYVVTVHDLSAWECPGLEPLPWWYWLYARWVMDRGIKRADGVIVRTPSTKARLSKLLGIPPGRIYVCPDGIRDHFEPPPYEYPQNRSKLILCVGSMVRRKNFETAVRAFSAIAGLHTGLSLVLVGRRGNGWPAVEEAINESRSKNRIIVCDKTSDATLLSLYQQARVLVAPSYYEGFGIPIIEAMACGLPVVASNIEVFSEVGGGAITQYGGGASDVDSLAHTLRGLFEHPGRLTTMSEMGLAQARVYRWRYIADRYRAIYADVLAGRLAQD